MINQIHKPYPPTVKVIILCITYALPLALSVACSYLIKSLISDDLWQVHISGFVAGALAPLIVFLTINLPQSPIRRWCIGTLFKEHGWKRGVFLLIVPSVVVLILILAHLTISLLNCRINMHSECDFEFSRQALVTWLFFCFHHRQKY